MDTPEQDRKQALVTELASLGGLIRGTLVHSRKKCGRGNCLCAKAGKLHPFICLSRSIGNKRHRLTYVKQKEEANFAQAVKEYNRAWEIIEELSAINIRSIKNGNCILVTPALH